MLVEISVSLQNNVDIYFINKFRKQRELLLYWKSA